MAKGMEIEWSSRAVKDMRRITERDRERIIAKIEQFATDPASLARQVISLTDSKYKRLRVGSHRVIFSTERAESLKLVVLRVRHRREAYE